MKAKLHKFSKVKTQKWMAEQQEAALEYAEQMYEPLAEEYAPFLEDDAEAAAFVLVMFGDDMGGEQDDAEDDGASADEDGMMFLAIPGTEEQAPQELDITRFSSVQEYCEAPFKKKANEMVYMADCTDGANFSLRKHIKSHGADMSIVRKWLGADSPKEAMERVTKGWPEGAQRALSMTDGMDAEPPESIKRRMQKADQGDELDVHSVYRGDLNRAWTRRHRSPMRSRLTVRLVARIDGSFVVNAETLFWRGAAVLKLSDMLEAAGYRVEIVGAQYTNVGGGDHGIIDSFIVKGAGDPLDVELVAGVICNAGFYRTYGFRAHYANSTHTHLIQERTLLSQCYVGGNKDCLEKGEFAADGTQTIMVSTNISDRESAVDWLKKTLDAVSNITVH